uniref:Uncharacterized protein n=1 Tax=Triticum urartu TaxID=4572 RepID=A0A8R7K2Y0_TRIUA
MISQIIQLVLFLGIQTWMRRQQQLHEALSVCKEVDLRSQVSGRSHIHTVIIPPNFH